MLDIKLIREQTEAVKTGLGNRNFNTAVIDEVLKLDEKYREQRTRLEQKQQALNAASKAVGMWIGKLKKEPNAQAPKEIADVLGKAPTSPEDAKEQLRLFGDQITNIDRMINELTREVESKLQMVPNLPSVQTPVGKDEHGNVVRKTWGDAPKFNFKPKPHWELGKHYGLELEIGGRISGSGFPFLRGPLARLERALINLYIDFHTRENGYTECWTPFMVRRETLVNSGQLPKFEEEMYQLGKGDELYLIPTAEVPLTSVHADSVLDKEQLPIRYCAFTPCFRREAGAAGKDTRGILRVHQFSKVEMMVTTTPDKSAEEHETLTRCAERLLETLELPHRRLELCTGDIGFGAARCYDLEVFAVGVDKWLEVSSCSNFTDYQARRAKIRFKDADKTNKLCHTLNGSGLALPRVMIGILENNQDAEGRVRLPKALHAYYGKEFL